MSKPAERSGLVDVQRTSADSHGIVMSCDVGRNHPQTDSSNDTRLDSNQLDL